MKRIKRLTIELDEDTFYKFKEFCVKNKTTFKDELTNFINKRLLEK